MGKDPDRIRVEIEETRAQLSDDRPADVIRQEIRDTREQMADTVHALGRKADVKGRMRESVARRTSAVASTIASGKNRVHRQSPAGLALAGAAVGFLVGLVVPSTRVEDEKIGETVDDLKGTVKETGQEALERGKHVVQQAVDAAKETASEGTREQGQGIAEALKDSAREVAPTGGSSGA
jgi:hypothetical protein